MSSVRVEGDAFCDARYECLAKECDLADADHARGKMLRLWRQCTLENRYTLAAEDVIQVLGERGPDALVKSRLGNQTRVGIRIRGTKGRIEWLERLRENGRKGGRPKKTKSKPSGLRELNPPAPAPAPAPALMQNPPYPPSGGSRSVRAKRDFSDAERCTAIEVMRMLSKHSGVAYRGADNHVGLIVSRLRSGITGLDLRKVAWYCAIKLEWKSKPEMKPYLRPETLFGPKTIDKYLDAAISAYRTEFKTDEDIKPSSVQESV